MYTVNVVVACQFDDTGWDYLYDPIYTKSFDTIEEAEKVFEILTPYDYDYGKMLHENDDCGCIAFELETTITEDDSDFAIADGYEYFENMRIWTIENYEDYC